MQSIYLTHNKEITQTWWQAEMKLVADITKAFYCLD